MNKTNAFLFYQRLAVRESETSPWRWFDQPIAFFLRHYHTASLLVEHQAVEAVFHYPTHHIHLIQAPSLAAFDRIDWSLIR